MKPMLFGFLIYMASIVFGLSRGLSTAETDYHDHGTAQVSSSAKGQTKRIPLNLPLEAQEGLKLTMREHLEAINSIVAALSREDFANASKLAHEELGFPKHHLAMQREGGATFPSAYHELAMAHHEAAEALGEVISTKDLKQILPNLEATIHVCVKCHQAFRL